MITCDCSVTDYDPNMIHNEEIRTARQVHICGECGDPIQRGERYEHVRAMTVDRWWFTAKTCLICRKIRSDYCPNGFLYGGLGEAIWECLGFDYRDVPDDDDE